VKRLLFLAAFQIVAILSWAAYHEHVWATAPTFRIPLRPRDPFDLIRGRYFVLNPLDTSVDPSTTFPEEQMARFAGSEGAFVGPVLAGFCPVEQLYRVCALARPDERPSFGPVQYWTKGFATVRRIQGKWNLDIDLGLRRFFIPNRLQLPARENEEGWELEVSYRPGLSALPRRLLFRGRPIELR
jgi:hypothetical protein